MRIGQHMRRGDAGVRCSASSFVQNTVLLEGRRCHDRQARRSIQKITLRSSRAELQRRDRLAELLRAFGSARREISTSEDWIDGDAR